MSTPTPEPPADAARLIFKTDTALLADLIPFIERFFYRNDWIKELAPSLFRIMAGSTTLPDHRLMYTNAYASHVSQAEISVGKEWVMIGPTNGQVLNVEKNGWRSLLAGPPDVGNDGTISGAITMQEFVDAVFAARHNASNPKRLRDRHACIMCNENPCNCKNRRTQEFPPGVIV